MSEIPVISVGALAKARETGATVIDVRNPHEWDEAHLAGSSLIPMPDLAERIDEVPVDGTVYLICATGKRSGRAAILLRRNGVDAVNVTGGIVAWVESGHPVVKGTGDAGLGSAAQGER